VAAGAVGLALGAAVLHAVWNLLLARAPDTEAATAVALALGVALFAIPLSRGGRSTRRRGPTSRPRRRSSSAT
jgi:hypothetical protein